MEEMMLNFWSAINQRKPEYLKVKAARKINSEILEALYKTFDADPEDYFTNLRSTLEACYAKKILPDPYLYSFQSDDDSNYLIRAILYMGKRNNKTIVEDFIERKKYRKPEKVTMLHSLKDANTSIYSFEDYNEDTLSIVLKDLKTNKLYTITDLSLSFTCKNSDMSKKYIAGNIITYNDVSFLECSCVFEKNHYLAKKLIDSYLKKGLPPMIMLLTAYKISFGKEVKMR